MESIEAVTTPSLKRKSLGLILLILVQAFAAVFFLSDTFADIWETRALHLNFHSGIELAAALSLALSVAVEIRFLLVMLRRQESMERGLSIASGALHDLMDSYFRQWGLTPSEQDVATFAIKGASIAEIAALRGCAEGTVKAHLNAIYRKSGAAGRGELVSLLIEDLMSQPLVSEPVSENAQSPAE